MMLAANWRNPTDSLDVNADGNVSPIDSLVIINYLNRGNSAALPVIRPAGLPFVDSSGDGRAEPIDALRIVNFLNRAGTNPNTLESSGTLLDVFRDIEVTVGLEGDDAQIYRMRIDAQLQATNDSRTSPDFFSVYLVDPDNPTLTLLDRSQQGTSVFTLYPDGRSELATGLARWDGNVLELDFSNVDTLDTALLRVQLLQSSPSNGSKVQFRPLSNEVSENVTPGSFIPNQRRESAPAGEVDFSALQVSENVTAFSENPRFDPVSGSYRASLTLRNLGSENAGNNIVMLIPGLPEGVSVANASGFTSDGLPYINFSAAIPNGGLSRNAISQQVEIVIHNPDRKPFDLQPQVFVGSENQAPILESIEPQEITPGQTLGVPIIASDPDGDSLTYTVASAQTTVSLPTLSLDTGSGKLEFSPEPNQIGTYQVIVSTSDGSLTTSQSFELSVVGNSSSNTIISGRILDVDESPISGLAVEIGGVQTLTQADGRFELDLGNGVLTSDTLRVRGETFLDPNHPEVRYPFIAEKLPFMFGREVYVGYRNELNRPIYLPRLNAGSPVNPASDTTIEATLREGQPPVQVDIAAGSLFNQQGTPFSGNLSITEVPVDRTPAALPSNLFPDMLITIQPGEMVFSTPAPLTFPNTAGWAPGLLMDLWSISPVTGEFQVVGEMQVSADGSLIETISGGIRNSSWHFPAPPPPPSPPEIDNNDDDDCDECEEGGPGASQIMFHTGALVETHELVSYHSLGATRGLVLNYDSLRADPRPIIHTALEDVDPTAIGGDNAENLRLVSRLRMQRGNYSASVPGYEGDQFGLFGGENFWSLPDEPGDVDAALQVDMRMQPTGKYDYVFSSGIRMFSEDTQRFGGTDSRQSGHILHVNSIDSPFGSGWGLAGHEQIVENPDGTAIIVDGDGSELLFRPSGAAEVRDFLLPDLATNSILRYDGLTGDLLGTFVASGAGGLAAPHNPTFGPDGNLYVFSNANNGAVNAKVLRFDGQTGAFIDVFVDTGSGGFTGSAQMAFGPDGHLYLSSLFSGSESAVLKFDGSTGAPLGIAASGNGIQRACGIAFGPDGNLYVGDSDPSLFTRYDRVLRFDTEGNFIDVFVPSGNLDDTCPIDFGADGNLYIADQQTRDIRKFDGATGTFMGVFAVDARLGTPFRATSGIDGNIYIGVSQAGTAGSIARVDGTTGKYIDSFVGNNSGFGTFFPGPEVLPTRRTQDLLVQDVVNDTIVRYDGLSGERIGQFVGRGAGGLDMPHNPTFGPDGNLYVFRGTAGQQQILRFNGRTGSFLDVFVDTGEGGFAGGSKMLFDSMGNLFVATASAQVLQYDSDGDFVRAIGSAESGLQAACGIGFGSDDSLLVYDTFDEEMRLFSLETGDLITLLIPSSNNLVNACDFAIEVDGDILITDATLGGVRRFDSETGEFLGVFATTSSTAASGVTVGPDGDLYVNVGGNTDRFNGQTGAFVERFVSGNGGFVNFVPPIPDVAESVYLSPVGDFSTLERLSDGAFRRTMKDQTIVYYNVDGQIAQSIDRNNNVVQWLYDEAGNLTQWIDPVGLVTTLSYTDGRVTSIKDPADRVTQLQYDTGGNLTSITDPDGTTRIFEYDANHLMIAETDQRGNREQAIYDFAGRVDYTIRKDGSEINLDPAQVRGLYPSDQTKNPFDAPQTGSSLTSQSTYVDSNGNVRTTTLDGAGQKTASNDPVGLLPLTQFDMETNLPSQIVDARGNITNYVYDPKGNLVQISDSVNPESPLVYTYDSKFNRLTSVTDELGRQTLYDIDPENGNVRSITRVIGSLGEDDLITQFQFTAQGLIKSITDPLGRVNESLYDSLGRLTHHTFSVGTSTEATVQYQYDLAGNISASTDENGNQTLFQYDTLNRLKSITESDPDGNGPLVSPITLLEYDAMGNLVVLTDQRNNRTEFEYDQLSRLVRVVDAKGQASEWTYDRAGNVLSSSDPLFQTTRFVYDERNRLIEKVEPDGTQTRFEYDLDDNLTTIIDSNSNTTRYAYDARNRISNMTDELGNFVVYNYDLSDNLISTIDRSGRVTSFVYDDVNRLVTESWGDDENVIHYNYDANGNLLSLVDNFSSLSFAYDSRDRVASVDNLGTPDAPHVILNYTYDSVGNLLSVVDTINGDAGGSIAYHFDSLNRLDRMTQSGTNTDPKRVDFSYDAMGQFTSIHRFSDLAGTSPVVDSNFSYDQLNRMLRIEHAAQSGILSFFDYVYDPAGRITQITGVDGATAYEYDRRSQLLGAIHSDVTNPDEEYAYDLNGNRISATVVGSSREYETGLNNQLLSDGRYSFTYDEENNLTLRTEISTGITREFLWDNRNRLVAVVDRDADGVELQRVEFTYDALDRRISKSVVTEGDSVTNYFVYDRENVLLDFVDPDGVAGAGSAVLEMRYLHGPAVDQVLAQDDGNGNVHWMLADHLGTVTDLVDSLGVVKNHLRYDSYGNVVTQSDASIVSRYRFTGREFDEETGLQFNRTRYYDPSIGKFISEDLASFLADSFNLHEYANNQPTRLRDPFGFKGSATGDPTGLGGLGESFGKLLPDPGSLANSGSNFLIDLLPDDGHLGRLKDLLKKARDAVDLEKLKKELFDEAQKKLNDAINKQCPVSERKKLEEALKKAKEALDAVRQLGIDLQREIVNHPGYQQYSQMLKRWRLDLKKQIGKYNIR